MNVTQMAAISRDRMEQMVNTLVDLLLERDEADFITDELEFKGFSEDELRVLGFDIGEED